MTPSSFFELFMYVHKHVHHTLTFTCLKNERGIKRERDGREENGRERQRRGGEEREDKGRRKENKIFDRIYQK